MTRSIPSIAEHVTILDLGCGAAQMAAPLQRAIEARGTSLHRQVEIDFADSEWMPARAAREF